MKYETIRILDKTLFKQAKVKAAQDGVSLLLLMETALREYLNKA
jgi:predicted HicB family RNase H-like nuclease